MANSIPQGAPALTRTPRPAVGEREEQYRAFLLALAKAQRSANVTRAGLSVLAVLGAAQPSAATDWRRFSVAALARDCALSPETVRRAIRGLHVAHIAETRATSNRGRRREIRLLPPQQEAKGGR